MANNKPKPTTTPPPDLAILQASHSHLSAAAHLLDGFVHRNRNQHRGTRWWGPFDMLRRSVRKLVPDLEGAVQRAEYLSSSSSVVPAKRRKMNDGKGAARAKHPGMERLESRARWVHDVVAVKAYEAFTQLLADRQFAQLGLMLIGVLAQVEAAVAPFAGPAEGDEEGGPVPAQPVGTAGRGGGHVAAAAAGGTPGAAGEDSDLGVAISREELGDDDDEEDLGLEEDVGGASSRRPPRRSSPSPPPPPRKAPAKDQRPEKGGGIKGKKRSRAEDGGSAGTDKKPEKPRLHESSRDEKKAKKKKKKKGGDEFDDLFSSLM